MHYFAIDEDAPNVGPWCDTCFFWHQKLPKILGVCVRDMSPNPVPASYALVYRYPDEDWIR